MDNKTLVHQFAALCNAHNTMALAEVVAPDYRQHNPMVAPGLAGLQQGFEMFLLVFPDLSVIVEEVVAEQDKVVARLRWRGTHSAAFLGIEATMRHVEWQSSDFWCVTDGKFAEHWDVVDWAGLRHQLTTPHAA